MCEHPAGLSNITQQGAHRRIHSTGASGAVAASNTKSLNNLVFVREISRVLVYAQ